MDVDVDSPSVIWHIKYPDTDILKWTLDTSDDDDGLLSLRVTVTDLALPNCHELKSSNKHKPRNPCIKHAYFPILFLNYDMLQILRSFEWSERYEAHNPLHLPLLCKMSSILSPSSGRVSSSRLQSDLHPGPGRGDRLPGGRGLSLQVRSPE